MIAMPYFGKQIYKREDALSRKTVFLDRDGTLIDNKVEYISDPSRVHLLPGVARGIRKLNSNKIVLIIVTNQPVIARGMATIKDVKQINNTLTKILNKKQAYVNAIYFCPHHPEKHHPDIPQNAMKYRIECQCRKPMLAMFKKAVEDFNINLEKVFIIGDNTRDVKAGKNLGITTILVQTGYKGPGNSSYSISPDYVVSDFSQAVDIICKR